MKNFLLSTFLLIHCIFGVSNLSATILEHISLSDDRLDMFFSPRILIGIRSEAINERTVHIIPVFKHQSLDNLFDRQEALAYLCQEFDEYKYVVKQTTIIQKKIIEINLVDKIRIQKYETSTSELTLDLHFILVKSNTSNITKNTFIGDKPKRIINNKTNFKPDIISQEIAPERKVINNDNCLKIANRLFLFKHIDNDRFYDEISYNQKTPKMIAQSIKDNNKMWRLPSRNDINQLILYRKSGALLPFDIKDKRIYIDEPETYERKYPVSYISHKLQCIQETIDSGDMAFFIFVSH